MSPWLAFVTALLVAQPQVQDAPNSLLLVAKPELSDPNFRETVVLVTQAADASTVGVILNRGTHRKHDTGEPIGFGGPVMREVLVTLFRSERAPDAPAFHVLKGVYLSMHPRNIEMPAPDRRLFAGFSGWAPGQLESEFMRDGWYVLPASAELLFRNNTAGMWEELVRKARGRVAMR
jgi:putative transcriptional regulator